MKFPNCDLCDQPIDQESYEASKLTNETFLLIFGFLPCEKFEHKECTALVVEHFSEEKSAAISMEILLALAFKGGNPQ